MEQNLKKIGRKVEEACYFSERLKRQLSNALEKLNEATTEINDAKKILSEWEERVNREKKVVEKILGFLNV